MITLTFIALFTLASAAVALSLRNLIHSALLLIASWAGIAGFYLWAGAEFVAFAQILVYVGAISMVVLFAVLLTRQSRLDLEIAPSSARRIFAAIIVGGGVLGALVGAVLSTPLASASTQPPPISVQTLGTALLGRHTASVLVIGILLTVALLGAVVIAASEGRARPPGGPLIPDDAP